MIQHLIHSSILAVLFYAVYYFFLKKETFFQWNRVYLLAIPFLSISIPFLSAPFSIELAPLNEPVASSISLEMTENLILTDNATPLSVETPINYLMFALIVYGIGVFISLLAFLYKISTIKEIIRKGTSHFSDEILITRTSQKLTAFSFFNNVVIDEKLDHKKAEEIIAHERIHIKQLHSLDLVTYELCKIIFWFHPIPYLVQRELKLVHEYIVDQFILKNQESKTYQESLLKTIFGTDQFSLASSYFDTSFLKNRILMLQKKKSTSKSLFKLAFLLPIILGSMIFTACTQDPEIDTASEKINGEEKSTFIPRLSKFEYDQKDFYNGLSKDDIEFYNSDVFFNGFLKDSLRKDRKEDIWNKMQSDEGKRYIKILSIIMDNSKTLVVDDVNENFNVIYISESPKSDPSYMTAPSEWNTNSIHSFVKGFLVGAGKDKVSELDDEVYNEMMTLVIGMKENTIKETIEIEEIKNSELGVESIYTDIPFAIMDIVPQYPGTTCSGTASERKKCFSNAISTFVNQNFDIDKFKGTPGNYKIACQFKIDTNGKVVDVMTKARSTEMQQEAARVLNLLPTMAPGSHNGKNVKAIYALPILFEIKK
jgi:hypothetical protein